MDHVVTAWVIVTLIFGVLAFFAVWSRLRSVARGIAMVLFFVGAPVVGVAAAAGLGWAVPVIPYLTAPAGEDYRVLGTKMVQGEAIYVLLDTIGEPRYYRLPWDQETADKLQDMMDDPNNGGIVAQLPFEFSWDQNAVQFHPLPQPKAMPDKLEPEKKAPHFDA